MSSRRPAPARVGIRELRQNLSVYVRHVREHGQAYVVTERGEPVARLVPVNAGRTQVERMMAEGRIAPASRHLDDVRPPLRLSAHAPLSQILEEQRAEDAR